MNADLALRQIALAAVALVAIVAAVAIVTTDEDEQPPLPQATDTPWYSALAAPYRFPPGARQTACGHPTSASTLGVAHPVLPCGAKVVILYGDREVLTQVVDRGTGVPGREFDVTAPLARRIGLNGVRRIKWRFARAA